MKKIMALMLMVFATTACAHGGHRRASYVASKKDPFGKTMVNNVDRKLEKSNQTYHAPKLEGGHYHFTNPFTGN